MYNIVVNVKEDSKEIYLLENGILVERIKEQKNIEGNIYLGKVQNVLPGMQAAFVDIGEEKNTFIHLKDLLPKVDETQQKHELNKNIKEVVKPGMEILVQVKRAENYKKGAKISTHISLTGKYLVLMPNTSIITISQKIEEKTETDRLKQIVKKILPKNMGAIIRTSARRVNEDEIEKDANKLLARWEKIEKNKAKAPMIIEKSAGALEKMLIDLNLKEISSIITNNKKNVESIIEKLGIQLKIEEKKVDLTDQIEKADNRKIWLKCGGFITIDRTEALTAIDVNSGKYTGIDNVETTIFKVNKEASIEIAKQLRLRDIGGIIIIDYIDMKNEENKEKIIETLREELKKDRTKT